MMGKEDQIGIFDLVDSSFQTIPSLKSEINLDDHFARFLSKRKLVFKSENKKKLVVFDLEGNSSVSQLDVLEGEEINSICHFRDKFLGLVSWKGMRIVELNSGENAFEMDFSPNCKRKFQFDCVNIVTCSNETVQVFDWRKYKSVNRKIESHDIAEGISKFKVGLKSRIDSFSFQNPDKIFTFHCSSSLQIRTISFDAAPFELKKFEYLRKKK